MKYVFHPAALIEYSQAVEFYAEHNREVAQEFINSVENTIFQVIKFPLRWPIVEEYVRRCLTLNSKISLWYFIHN
nr:hypothetical protein [Spirulina major]